MRYEFVAIPDEDVPAGRRPGVPAPRHDLRQRDEQDGQRVAGRPRRPARLPAPREDEHDPGDPGPPDPLGAAVLRPVRRHRGAARRGAAAAGRAARRSQAYVDRYVALAKPRLPQLAAATPAWWLEERAVLRRPAPAADLDVLAAGAAHLPPPDPGPDLAPAGGRGTVPAIYGPSGDVTWDEADPTYSVEARRPSMTAGRPVTRRAKGPVAAAWLRRLPPDSIWRRTSPPAPRPPPAAGRPAPASPSTTNTKLTIVAMSITRLIRDTWMKAMGAPTSSRASWNSSTQARQGEYRFISLLRLPCDLPTR